MVAQLVLLLEALSNVNVFSLEFVVILSIGNQLL